MTKWLPLLGLVLVTLVASCSKGLDVIVIFPVATDVEPGDPVMLEGTQIGKVSELDRLNEGARVHLALDPDKSKRLRSNSAAMVTVDDSHRVVEIFNSSTGESPLPSGHELLAITSRLELLAWQAGDVIDQTSRQIGETISSLQDYFSSPEWNQKKQTLRDELADIERSAGRSAQEIRGEVETMLKSLESKSKVTADELNEQFDALKDDLGKLGQELAKEGKQTLLPALDRMLMTLRETLERYQNSEHIPPQQKQSS